MAKYNLTLIFSVIFLGSLHLATVYYGFSPYTERKPYLGQNNYIAFKTSGKITKTAIASNPDFGYDIYLVGSSRLRDGLNPETAEKLTGKSVFNYGVSGLLISEMKPIIEHLLETKEPTSLIIGLDFFAFNDRAKPSQNMTLKVRRSIKDNITLYLSKFSLLKVKEQMAFQKQNIHCFANGFCKDNRFSNEDVANYIQKGLNTSNDKKGHVLYGFESYEKSLSNFKNIVDQLMKRGIDTRFFISPSHNDYMTYLEGLGLHATYKKWKNDITNIIRKTEYPLYDFEIKSPATTLPYLESHQFFNDDLHYKETFGDIILKTVLNGQKRKQYEEYSKRLN